MWTGVSLGMRVTSPLKKYPFWKQACAAAPPCLTSLLASQHKAQARAVSMQQHAHTHARTHASAASLAECVGAWLCCGHILGWARYWMFNGLMLKRACALFRLGKLRSKAVSLPTCDLWVAFTPHLTVWCVSVAVLCKFTCGCNT